MDTNLGSEPTLFALLQIAAMLLGQCMLGLSFSRCLWNTPGRFTHQAMSGYFETQRGVDVLWFVGAGVWLLLIGIPANDPEALVDAQSLHVALMCLWLLAAGIQFWMQWSVAAKVRRCSMVGELFGAEDVTKIDEHGYYATDSRDLDPDMAISGARVGVAVFGVLTAAALLFVVILSWSLGASSNVSTLVAHGVLCGLWLSARVFIMDLAVDVWPGRATPGRMRRAYLYYVLIFEQWKIAGVLVAFLIVMVVAPLATLAGVVPVATSSFALWIGSCLIFATCWNKVAYPAGRVPTTLPLPVAVNRYSAHHRIWAYFFACIHAVMLACLLAGIVALNAR